MSSQDILIMAGPILRILGVFSLGLAVLVLLRRRSPEWRVVIVRVTMLALPMALLLGLFQPVVSVPMPPSLVELKAAGDQLPRKGSALSIPWEGASLFPVEVAESAAIASAESKYSAMSFLRSLPVVAWLVGVWALGFVIMLSRELLGIMVLQRRSSQATPVSITLRKAWNDANQEMGRNVAEDSIMQLPDDSASPYLTPWPFSRLLIPSKLEERFSESEIGHLFRHEAAHLAGRDPAALLMMRMIACVFWFFPGAWWLASKHLDLCEECADARAARIGGVEAYREAVASFALEFVPSKSKRVMALLKKATVVERLKVLSGNVSKIRPVGWQKALLILVLFFVLAGVGRVGWAEVEVPLGEAVVPAIDVAPVPLITINTNNDPADKWYRGFLLIQKAKELEEKGEPDADVMNRYREALDIYDWLASEHPTYLPEIVRERIHLTREKLEEIRGRLRSGSGAAVHVSPSALAEPVLKIQGVTGKWGPDQSQGRKITLVVDIVSDSNARINPAMMNLKVAFYEIVAGTQLVPSIAEIETRYVTEPYSWKDGEKETIEIDYFLPKEVAETMKREYYGRIVELYYKGTLQYVVATPSKLDRLVK